MLTSDGSPQRLDFWIRQKVGAGLWLWREWVREDSLEAVVHGTFLEEWGGSLRGGGP